MAPTTLFLRDFTVLDFAFLDAQDGLQGESFYVSVELSGTLDRSGFIFDFGPAKKLLKKLVDDSFDHKLVIPSRMPSLQKGTEGWILKTPEETFEYSTPEAGWVLLGGARVTKEALAAELASLARAALPTNVEGVRFELREDTRFEKDANFRYTHGLRYHEGNCQRLFHGHRNPIEVFVAGKREEKWEAFLAEQWEGAHFTSAPTLVNRDALDLQLGVRAPKHTGTAEISYGAPQGNFSAKIPAARVVLLENEPSIENIAKLGHDLVRGKGVSGELCVRAYEGLNKGASFSSLR
ncbi:MAG: 6-carboxytetrahydropterin synthase [Bdellovibrionota bacterium]